MIRNALFGCIGAACGFLAAFLLFQLPHNKAPRLATDYQLVLLANGQTFFGKLQNPDSHYPVLTNVFYIQSQTDPNTKNVTNKLIKRGKEWHEPDVMILNARQIVLIEPVKATSTVANLIKGYTGR